MKLQVLELYIEGNKKYIDDMALKSSCGNPVVFLNAKETKYHIEFQTLKKAKQSLIKRFTKKD